MADTFTPVLFTVMSGDAKILEAQNRDNTLRMLIEEKSLDPQRAIELVNDAERYGERLGANLRILTTRDPVEYGDVVYSVTLTLRQHPDDADQGVPTEREIKTALYRGLSDIDSEDAIHVERQ